MSPALPTYFIALTDSWCWCDASVFHAVPILGLVLCRAVLSTYTSCFLAEHKQLASLSSLLLLAGSASSSSLFLKHNDANDPSPQNDASRQQGCSISPDASSPAFPMLTFRDSKVEILSPIWAMACRSPPSNAMRTAPHNREQP